jgi:DNA adenine methylase
VAKVVCPRCGQGGYLTRVKVYNNYYMRVEHHENGKRRVCYLGKDVNELRRMLEEAIGGVGGAKILRLPGGDYKIADVLLPRLERLCVKPRCTFVEVFGGSGYMTQSVSRKVFGNIVYNDINNMLTTLYMYVKEHPEQLATLLALLPYSRAYYRIVRDLAKVNQDFASLAAAALFFYAYNTAFHGNIMRKGFAYGVDPAKNEARAYRGRVWAIVKYAEVWRDVIIENLDFCEVIKKYDARRTVFYLDPPYPDRSADYYGTPFTVDDLREMAQILTEIKGRFLLKLDKKTYDLISDILPNGKYNVETFERKLNMQRVRGTQRGTWKLVLVSSR